ncbi:low molecular weight protein-tyrosine-phosphatase [Paraliomyxa miuraensis]|uniref:low molecular weight protein-tyrosine-phosphatase n=1 Tax=Paraliomyxa miuraensis TaxID=376150 RepID=UPI00225AD6D9|nr:low molecular weight protein-tyrosine-phosphatase [Paraliomyxa miuraensis]MCX4242147.1 low molecular weight phosphotyrosine protein phosphatase [Paraliomyxa miuraensis]
MSAPGARGVLFVCHANMCRSPLAAGVFAHLAAEAGARERFEIDSAGTWAAEGIAPHPGSVEAARRHGIEVALLGTGSRSIVPGDLDRFAHIVVMDRRNLADIERLRRISAFGPVVGGSAEISLLRRFSDPKASGRDADVPDPVRGGHEQFEAAYAIIETGCRALLQTLLRDR